MDVALLKPDWRILGGGELAVSLVQGILEQLGHRVHRFALDVPALQERGSAIGVPMPSGRWASAPEFFDFAAAVPVWRNLDLSSYDLVVSTQPPSYAAQHPAHLSFFQHHQRHFYDLAEIWVRAGFAEAATHARACSWVRAVDDAVFPEVRHFLTNSRRVAERLRDFNGRERGLSVLHLPPMQPPVNGDGSGSHEHALVVSRHEFPKRTELAAAALSLVKGQPSFLVGGGGRLGVVRRLAGVFEHRVVSPEHTDAEDLWLSANPLPGLSAQRPCERVRVCGRVSDETLADLYRRASCVVAPAFDEDFGLTALEAMSNGKPLVVCRDGGGLAELVQDGVNGFVVTPEPVAIAAAVQRLIDDPSLARQLGENGREIAGRYTLARARRDVAQAVDLTMEASR